MNKWKTQLSIALIILAVVYEWSWLWALFAAINLWQAIKQDKVYLVEEIDKNENPLLYYLIIFLFCFFGIFSIGSYLLWW